MRSAQVSRTNPVSCMNAFTHRAGPDVSTVEELRSAGVEVVDEVPRIGSGGTTIAFVHPKSAHGVLN
jgi:hypothetical protein